MDLLTHGWDEIYAIVNSTIWSSQNISSDLTNCDYTSPMIDVLLPTFIDPSTSLLPKFLIDDDFIDLS